jgi:hypothetical protein
VLVDLPAVAEAADATLRAAGVRERCEIVGADFFTDALPAADAYVLPRVLHDWDDGRSSVTAVARSAMTAAYCSPRASSRTAPSRTSGSSSTCTCSRARAPSGALLAGAGFEVCGCATG